jgi:hypothetical protein
MSIVDEEPNAVTAKCFDLMKDSDEPLWDGCTNHSKLLVVAKVFIIKSDHELSSSGYTRVNTDDNDEINVEVCDGDEN